MGKIKKGFTLIELIVTLVILSIIMTALYTSFLSTMKINKSVTDKSELQSYATTIQRTMYNDIRRANIIVDSKYDAALGKYIFEGPEMSQYNEYCRIKGYKPLIYIENISNDKVIYTYNQSGQEIIKISVPVSGFNRISTTYHPFSDICDGTNATNWGIIPQSDEDDYEPPYEPKGFVSINSGVDYSGLVIKYTSGGSTITLNSFTKIGAYKNGEYNILVLKSNTRIGGVYRYFKVFMNEEVTYDYSQAKEKVLSKYVAQNGGIDGITLSKHITGAAGQDKGYYDISLYLKNNEYIEELKFKVSMVDYGGDIK